MIKKILPLLLLPLSLLALEGETKHLLLAQGGPWLPLLAQNLIENHKYIENLPFSGFVMVGNSYTNKVMQKDEILKDEEIWNEVKGLAHLYSSTKHNFMQINIDFPADFWDDQAWKQVRENFALVAKSAKKLGFKGIVFDDEPYSKSAHKMVNFKFPTRKKIAQNRQKYSLWEKRGSQPSWVDEDGYANPNFNFKEHMNKVTKRFQTIMEAMLQEYPNMTVLVYNGASFAHENSNMEHRLVVDVGLAREHEYKGAIFLGLKKGLNALASLYDMGESYRYRENEQFQHYYQWRKYQIAEDKFNDTLDNSYQWSIPKEERSSWSKEVQVGFMVFNKAQKSSYSEFDTQKKSSIKEIQKSIQKALKYSDKYALFYCEEQNWLQADSNFKDKKSWLKMMRETMMKERKK